jgi:membrane dipeptidase
MLDPIQLHSDSIVFDAHCDFLHNTAQDGRRFDQSLNVGRVDLPRLVRGGVTAQIFAVWDHWAEMPAHCSPTLEALRQVSAFYGMLDLCSDGFMPATRASDVERARSEGKVAGVLSLEGTEPLAGDVALLRAFYELGVRNLGLTWDYRNLAADGVGAPQPGGLTDFGRELVRQANRLGIMIDIAHLAPRGVDDVLEIVDGPIIDSHANAHALCAHRRNLTDAQLDALAATGGVVCVAFVPGFITQDKSKASLDGVLDHIDYIARRIGNDHIGIGSDFDGYDGITQGLEDVTHFPALTAGLAARGYDEQSIRQILGLNLLRVFGQVAG